VAKLQLKLDISIKKMVVGAIFIKNIFIVSEIIIPAIKSKILPNFAKIISV
jgi:hypothetical protein